MVGVALTVGLFDIVIQSYLPLPKEWYTQAIPVLREAAFGLALIIVLLFRPLGLLGDMRGWQRQLEIAGTDGLEGLAALPLPRIRVSPPSS